MKFEQFRSLRHFAPRDDRYRGGDFCCLESSQKGLRVTGGGVAEKTRYHL